MLQWKVNTTQPLRSVSFTGAGTIKRPWVSVASGSTYESRWRCRQNRTGTQNSVRRGRLQHSMDDKLRFNRQIFQLWHRREKFLWKLQMTSTYSKHWILALSFDQLVSLDPRVTIQKYGFNTLFHQAKYDFDCLYFFSTGLWGRLFILAKVSESLRMHSSGFIISGSVSRLHSHRCFCLFHYHTFFFFFFTWEFRVFFKKKLLILYWSLAN